MKNIQEIQELQQFNNLEFIAQQVVEGFITGLHRSPFHGFSVEFAEHRLYNNGESTKHIDWKLFARTEKLFVKRFEEETNLRAFVVIDNSSSMLFPYKDKKIQSKLGFSVYCAAALIYLLRRQRDAVGLSLFSDQIELQTEAKLSSLHAKMLYHELENLMKSEGTLKKTTNASTILHQLAESIHKRSLIVLFSDMINSENNDDLFAALQHLRYNKHEVILFHVTDKLHEEEFKYNNRPYKFIDLENGNEIKLNPIEVRDFYKESIRTYFAELKLKCHQYNIDIVNADVNEDFASVLLPYLIKRGKLN